MELYANVLSGHGPLLGPFDPDGLCGSLFLWSVWVLCCFAQPDGSCGLALIVVCCETLC